MEYGSFVYTIYYVIGSIFSEAKQMTNEKQEFLSDLSDEAFSAPEAERVWTKIADHKWYISERLGRDVGFKVAALDYLENVHRKQIYSNDADKFGKLKTASLIA